MVKTKEEHSCAECKHWWASFCTSSTGICTSGSAQEATAQGLPKPDKGLAYVEYFAIAQGLPHPACSFFIPKGE